MLALEIHCLFPDIRNKGNTAQSTATTLPVTLLHYRFMPYEIWILYQIISQKLIPYSILYFKTLIYIRHFCKCDFLAHVMDYRVVFYHFCKGKIHHLNASNYILTAFVQVHLCLVSNMSQKQSDRDHSRGNFMLCNFWGLLSPGMWCYVI
jgi:hypothetical protein